MGLCAWPGDFGDRLSSASTRGFLSLQANLLVAAGEAAQGVVNGSVTRNSSLPNSFAVTSPSNAAQQGQVDSRGLLVYQPATTVINALDFQTFFGASYSNSSVKGIVLAPGTYSVHHRRSARPPLNRWRHQPSGYLLWLSSRSYIRCQKPEKSQPAHFASLDSCSADTQGLGNKCRANIFHC